MAWSEKNIVLIFNRPSTRTRCAFETAVFDEGGCVTVLENSHMGYKESIEDTARVFGQFYDGIAFRGEYRILELLQRYAGIPVWNGLTEQSHPTQILADLMTVYEYLNKPLKEIKVVYVGDGRNNVVHSWIIAAAKMNINFINLAPKALWPAEDFMQKINSIAKNSIKCDDQIEKALQDADVIYTDVWASMGEEKLWGERIQLLRPYQVNMQMLKLTNNPNVIFMHCLPALHDMNTELVQSLGKQFDMQCGLEVSDEVFRSRHSVVFDQTQNRLHTLKAVILSSLTTNCL